MDSQLTEHLPRMYRVALRILGDGERAEDAVQTACVRFLQHRARFAGRSQLATWLHRVTVNCCIDQQRTDRKHAPTIDPNAELAGMASYLEATPAVAAEWRELHEIAHTLVESLPDDCRAAFVLTQLDGYTYDEAAEIEGLSRGTVASRVYRAKKRLLAAMTEKIGG